MFLFPQIKRLPDSSSTFNSPHESFVFSNCSQRRLLGPYLLQNGIPQPKKCMGRRGEDVWIISNGNGRSEMHERSGEEKGGGVRELLLKGGREGERVRRRRRSGNETWRKPTFAGTGLRPARRLCSLWLRFHFCVVHNLSEIQRALVTTSYLCKEAASLDVALSSL